MIIHNYYCKDCDLDFILDIKTGQGKQGRCVKCRGYNLVLIITSSIMYGDNYKGSPKNKAGDI